MKPEQLELVHDESRPGYRLRRLEIYNWGTFDKRVWVLTPDDKNMLVTGDIGSGKSTLVDAVTTLLVPPQKLAYNKAAGADARERSLRSYVLGHYKSERGDAALAARPVPLRDRNDYSVLLATFQNEGISDVVTLAQVFFWQRETEGQPARFYVVADGALSIAEHFSNFGTEVADLRKKLRKQPKLELHETFPPYGAAFRRRFGIENELALELFHQTVSMKSIGNLTDFVREHMLEAFPVQDRIDALIGHFDDLNRAHEAVLKAKQQINVLAPLVVDCDRHEAEVARRTELRACRDALQVFFAWHKRELLGKRIENLEDEVLQLSARIASEHERHLARKLTRDELKRAIMENGGDRLDRIKDEIERAQKDKDARRERALQYERLAFSADLQAPHGADAFVANRRAIEASTAPIAARQAELENKLTDTMVELRALRQDHAHIAAELESLRTRRSNIPRDMLSLRERLCTDLSLNDDDVPFAGELIQVRPPERDWEGAIERLLRGFGLSLLVHDADYSRVAQWVEQTHLRGRLVYYRVRARHAKDAPVLHPEALARKLSVKPDSPFYDWLDVELAHRFDHACCDSVEQFRRETVAITRNGQIKTRGERHEKDDRHRIDDRSRYVLGWSNEAKIEALEREAESLVGQIQRAAGAYAVVQAEQAQLKDRATKLQQLLVFESFRDLDWRPLVSEIERLESERRDLENSSDVLRELELQLAEVEADIKSIETDLEQKRDARSKAQGKKESAEAQRSECAGLLSVRESETKTALFPRLEALRAELLPPHTLTVESCDSREKALREVLQARIDAIEKVVSRLAEHIVKVMQTYRKDYPVETQEADASIEAAPEYRRMLEHLRGDDLPRFESRFKQLLNENTIREVANFQSQLARERQTIKERIDLINRSLRDIDYNPGRYIVLEPNPALDTDIRDFQQDLRACTEDALTGSQDETYSEAKFLQVKHIIQRFRGREGLTDEDRRWRRKVTDVRDWFTFSASERWREDDREHEHYQDSGGKSGGQKEKLAYTVLAASLVYQFGLDAAAARPRAFRFVVIDEAFGRGSDESARYGLELFKRLQLQLLVVTPLQKIHVIEPYVAGVGFVHNEGGKLSMLRNLTIEEYRAERAARSA